MQIRYEPESLLLGFKGGVSYSLSVFSNVFLNASFHKYIVCSRHVKVMSR